MAYWSLHEQAHGTLKRIEPREVKEKTLAGLFALFGLERRGYCRISPRAVNPSSMPSSRAASPNASLRPCGQPRAAPPAALG